MKSGATAPISRARTGHARRSAPANAANASRGRLRSLLGQAARLRRKVLAEDLLRREAPTDSEREPLVDLENVAAVYGPHVRDVDLGRSRQEIREAASQHDRALLADLIVMQEKRIAIGQKKQIERTVKRQSAMRIEAVAQKPYSERWRQEGKEVSDLDAEVAAIEIDSQQRLDKRVVVVGLEVAARQESIEPRSRAEAKQVLVQVLAGSRVRKVHVVVAGNDGRCEGRDGNLSG